VKRVRRGRSTRAKLVIAALALCLLSFGGCLAVSFGGRHAARNVVLPRLAQKLDARLAWGEISSTLGSLSIDDLEIRFDDVPEAEIDVPRLEVSYRLWPLLLGRIEIGRVALVSPTIRFSKIDASTISRARARLERLATHAGASSSGGIGGAASPEVAVVDGAFDAHEVAGVNIAVEGIGVMVADQGRFEVTAASAMLSAAGDDHVIARLGSSAMSGIRDPDAGIDIDEASVEGAQVRWVFGPGENDLSRAASGLRALFFGAARAEGAETQAEEAPSALSRGDLSRVQLPPSIHVARSEVEIVIPTGDRGDRTLRLTDVQGQLYVGTDEEPPSLELAGRLEPGQGQFEIDTSLDADGLPSARAQLTALHLGQLASGFSISGFTVDESSVLDADVTVATETDGAIRFRGEITTAGVTVQGRLVAAAPVTDLRVRAVASGEYRRDEGSLSLDDARIFLNGIETRLSGHLARHAGRTIVDATADLSPIRCADLLEATPTALRDRLTGMMLTGLISGRGHFALDTEHVQDLELDVVFQNGCHATGTGQLSADRLSGSFLHRVQLPDEEVYEFQTGPGSGSWASMEQISPFMFAAVLSTEDGAFYHHSGYNLREIRTALIRDIEAGQPRFGASTITMQLARNLYLGRERTLARKLQEAVLTWYLESTLSKDEILTYYLNVIEFGPRVFGIRHAAMYYFGRQPDDLSPREAVFLAKLLPNPVQRHDSTYGEGELAPRWQAMIDRVLAVMRERQFITPAEYQAALEEGIVFFHEGDLLPLHRTWRARASSFESWGDDDVEAAPDRWLEIDADAEIPAPAELDDDFGDE
jgi:hypothetical protein